MGERFETRLRCTELSNFAGKNRKPKISRRPLNSVADAANAGCPSTLSNATKPKPGLPLLIGTTLLVLLNMGLGFALTMRQSGNVSEALGAATSQLVIPVVVTLLFSISPRFRNPRSRTKIVLWTSLIVFLATVGNLASP